MTALAFATALAPLGGTAAHAQAGAAIEAGASPFAEPPPLRGVRDPRVFAPVTGALLTGVRAPVTRLAAPTPPAPPVRRAAPEEADPFAPTGIRLGAFTLRPALTQSIGIDSNPERVAGPTRATTFSRSEASLALDSDWTRHALAIEARGRYDTFRTLDPRVSGEAGARLRLDIREWLDLTLDARGATARERAGSAELPTDLARGPQTSSLEGAATLEARGAHARVALRGSLARTVNGDARRLDGTIVSRREDDYLEPALALRAAWRVSPGLEPFVEAEIDERRYVERAASDRDSRGLTGRAGLRLQASALISGEASIGWQQRDFLAPGRGTISGPVAQAGLIWSPTPLTRVTLDGESRIAETRVAGAQGAQAVAATLGVSHELSRALLVDGSIGFARTDFRGSALTEDLLTATAGLEWRLTRTLALSARYTHERLTTSAPGGGYRADTALLGMRLTR